MSANAVQQYGDEGAAVQGTYLNGADLEAVDLDRADLQGAELVDANLQGASLRDSGLQGAFLGGANLLGADLRGANLWRALLDDGTDLGDRWLLADLREARVDPIEDADAWIEDAAQQIAEQGTRPQVIEYIRSMLGEDVLPPMAYEGTRRRVTEQLRAALGDDDRPEVPRFADALRSTPTAMLEPDDPVSLALGGLLRRQAENAYDQDLAAFLGDLACGAEGSEHVARGLARRLLGDSERVYARLLAAHLIGDDCPPAAGLPDHLRTRLRELSALPTTD